VRLCIPRRAPKPRAGPNWATNGTYLNSTVRPIDTTLAGKVFFDVDLFAELGSDCARAPKTLPGQRLRLEGLAGGIDGAGIRPSDIAKTFNVGRASVYRCSGRYRLQLGAGQSS
jgi:hypothetical protein